MITKKDIKQLADKELSDIAEYLWGDNSDWDWNIADQVDDYSCDVTTYGEVDGWEFNASGQICCDDIYDVYVEWTAPDGRTGTFKN